MSDEIARGVINIEARDEGALASLRRVEAQFDRTMADIDRQEAEVRLRANSAQFGKEIKKAKAELDELRKAKAEAKIDADTSALDRKIHRLERDLAFIGRQKVKVDVDVDTATVRQARSEIEGLSRLEEKRNAAEQKYAAERLKVIQQEARRRRSLSDQAAREFASDEAAAFRMDAARTREARQTDQQKVRVASLQREYAKLTDRIEALDKRHAFTREARMKLQLDTAEAFAKFELTKAELNRLGAHPPVDIRIDTRRSDLNRVQRLGRGLTDMFANIAQKAAGLSTMTLRLGPFTASVKQAVVAMSLLSPLITDLIGGATSLAGVLGTALAGSLSLGAGLAMGFATNVGGIVASLRPMAADLKIANQATTAYHKAVLKYGAGSKQAKQAQEQMNSTLKGLDPNAAQAAKGLSRMRTQWDALTQTATRRDVGKVLTSGFKTMNTVLPVVARNSKQSMSIIANSLQDVFSHIRANSQQAGGGILGSVGRSFNQFLAPALSGLEHLGAAFARIGESAARLFAGRAGNAFEKWTAGIDRATGNSGKLDSTMTRLGNHARDVGRLFMDFGRLLVTVFNGGADSGDKLVNQLDHAFQSWNDFLKSSQGQRSMATFFKRSADSVSSLAGALAPIAAAIGDWSNLMSPFTRGILDAISFISRLLLGITKVVGLGGPLAALGATFATLWAVGKMAAFVAMLSRVVSLINEARKAGSILAGLGVFTGGIGGALKGGGMGAGIEAAAASGAAEMGSAIEAASIAGAAEMGAAIRAAGVAAAAEEAAGSVAGGGIAAAETAGAGAAAGTAARAGAGAAEGAGGFAAFRLAAKAALGAILPFAAVAGGAGLAAVVFGGRAKDAADGVNALVSASHRMTVNVPAAGRASVGAFGQIADSTLGLKAANQQVATAQREVNRLTAAGKQGTPAYTAALQNLNSALDARTGAERQSGTAQRAALRANAALQETLPHLQKAQEAYGAATRKVVPDLRHMIDLHQDVRGITGKGANQLNAADLLKYGDALKPIPGYEDEWAKALKSLRAAHNELTAAQNNSTQAQQQFDLATVNAQRAIGGLRPMTIEAAQAVSQLTKSLGQNKVAKIAVQFPDPRQARQVMQSMNSAIASGTPKNRAFNVVANSSSAEQALRRLNAIRITPKRLQIIQSGGDAAVHMIERIVGRKLTPKEQKIAEKGGPAVLNMLSRITGHGFPVKVQPITQVGAAQVLSFLGRVSGFPLAPAIKAITERGGSGVLSILNHLLGLTNLGQAVKTLVMKTVHQGHATGGIEDPQMKHAFAAANRALPSDARGGRYAKPTYIVGEEAKTEYVIATNPAYRQRNIRYLQMAAADLGVGVEPAARGRAPKPRRPNNGGIPPKLRDYVGPVDLSDLDTIVENSKQAFDDFKSKRDSVIQDNKTRRRGHKHRVPSASRERSLKNTWQSYAAWDARAARQKRDFENLETRIDTLRTAMELADKSPSGMAQFENKNMTFDALRRKRGELIGTRTNELQRAVNDVTAKRAPGTKWVAALRQALGQSRLDAVDNTSTLSTPEQAAADAIKQANDDAAQRAKDDLATFGYAGGQADLDRLEAALARAQANDVPDDPTTIYKNEAADSMGDNLAPATDIASFWENVARRLDVPGADQSKVGAAYSALKSARDDVRSIQDATNPNGGGAATTTVGAQMMALSSARQDLYQTYGSNLAPVWTQPGSFPSAAPTFPNPGAYGQNPSSASVPQSTVVNQTINMSAPPPDPHTWSKGVAWELQAAL